MAVGWTLISSPSLVLSFMTGLLPLLLTMHMWPMLSLPLATNLTSSGEGASAAVYNHSKHNAGVLVAVAKEKSMVNLGTPHSPSLLVRRWCALRPLTESRQGQHVR